MNLMLVAEFIARARMQKTGLAVFFWSTLLLAKIKLPSICGDENFTQLALLIIICAFLGNVAEHYVRARYSLKEDKPDASAQP